MKFVKYALATLGMFILVAIAGVWAYDIYNRPNLVASTLKIEAPPRSLEVVDCKSPFTTDVLTTCAIKIAPEEFEELLAGYQFEYTATRRSSYSVGSSSVGSEFEVTSQYGVWPKEFKHGGAIHVFANKSKDKAIVDLYIE